ncbi:MAG: GntR family transcriptional regulator [Burkholderiaceae bacterium]
MKPAPGPRLDPVGLHRILRDDILRGRLAPGTRLGVRELARRYEAGPIPLREVLNRLHAERLVLHEARRGFFVGEISAADIVDLTLTRIWLYTGALERSIEVGGADWEEGIVLAYYRLDKSVRQADPTPATEQGECLDPHRAFHTALIAGCGSQRTIELSERLFDEAERYRHLSRLSAPLPEAHNDHRHIMDAALGRRADEAVDALRRHLNRTRDAVLQYLSAADKS